MRLQLKHILSPEKGAEIRTKLWWHSWNATQKPLPQSGFLAGGSVASVILSEAWCNGIDFPINDLDVFLIAPEKSTTTSTPVRITEIALDDDADQDEYLGWRRVRNSGYQVVKSEHTDLINTVLIKIFGNEINASSDFNLVLKGFDLNCCQVGINLANDRLIWTPAFEEFVSTGQLKVSHMATPYHTAIRLAKKQSELNCYCDLKTELSLLATYVDMVDALGYSNRKNRMYSKYIGRKYFDSYLQYSGALDDYCKVFPGTNQLMLPGTGVSVPHYYSLELKVPSFYQELKPLFNRSGGLQLSSVSMLQMFDKLFRPTTKSVTRRRFSAAITSGEFVPICAIQNSRFTNCDHHFNSLQKLERFAKSHTRVSCLLNRLGLNVAEQLTAIQAINRSVKKYGLFVIGLLEDRNNPILKETMEISEELIDQIVDDFKSNASDTQLTVPVDLSDFPRKDIVFELTSAQLLEEEGYRQHHCVGGYADAVRAGKCRIFHLELGGRISTLQILRSGNCAEHRARFNEQPPPDHMALAAELSAYIVHQKSGIRDDEYMRLLFNTVPPDYYINEDEGADMHPDA